MDEKKTEKCIEPKIKNSWERKKTFFEVAAAQSSLKNVNPDLPDSLVTPLITVLDPCAIPSKIHARVDWGVVKGRLLRGTLVHKKKRPTPKTPKKAAGSAKNSGNSGSSAKNSSNSANSATSATSATSGSSSATDGASDGPAASAAKASSSSSPSSSGNDIRAKRGEPMDLNEARKQAIRREKDIFINEMVELVKIIKKYNDPSLSSYPTWIDRLRIEKTAKNLILLQSYQPSLLTIEEIVNGLLFEHGPAVMERLLIEMPENLVSIVNALIDHQTAGGRTSKRNIIIGKIVTLYPYFARRIIYKFAERRSDCVFACRLAVDHLNDKQFLEFMEPMLVEKVSILPETTIYKNVVRDSNRQVLPIVVGRLLSMADAVLNPNPSPDARQSEMAVAPWCTRLAFCLVELLLAATEPWREREVVTVTKFVFRTTIITQPTDPLEAVEPMDTSFQDTSMTADSQESIVMDSEPESSRPPPRRPQIPLWTTVDASPFGDAHECFVLSALIAVPFFTQYPPNNTGAVQPPDHSVEKWLEISRRRVLAGEKVTSTFGTHLIFVHTCIMTSRLDDLGKYSSEGVKRTVELMTRPNHAAVLKNALITRCMNEIEVAKRSICQTVTKGSGTNTSFVLRAIYALQNAQLYNTFRLSIQPWLEVQLEHIQLPASKLLADIVDEFGNSTASGEERGFSKEFVESAFAGDLFDARTIPKRLFALLFLTTYREYLHTQDASLQRFMYDRSIFNRMPVRYLLTIIEQDLPNFVNIRGRIISRVTNIYPYSLPSPESMTIVAECQKSANIELIEEEEFGASEKERRLKLLKESKNIKKVLEAMCRSSVRDQVAALPIFINIFMESLKSSTPPGFEQPLITLFNRYEHLIPFPLFLQSVSTWIRDDTGIDVNDVLKIPSLIFRCDRRILSSPAHFHCFIRALNFCNKRCRMENKLKNYEARHLYNQGMSILKKNPLYDFDADKKEKELLTGAYLDIQQSVLIHALVEVFDSKRMNDDPSDFSLQEKRRQIRQIACEFIHRTFLDYEGLIRIALHQRFPLRQIREIVEGVPALFAGNSQILEMLSLADPERRFFAIVFAAEISRKYRVRESLETARVVCDIVHSLHKYGELPSSYKVWKHVAPALMILATEFPSLADSINRLLIRVSTTAKNRLSVRCGLFAGDPRHEEYQLISKIQSFLDRNSTRENL
ncbi:hypothetical protein CRE_08953 [Caenorhabditis remanei]|uniref:Uncharacterized protein n=1 Tax=Caenorhabditis remanei TaxID=31234 RepID=E3LIG0_CAERE|nr:hypothetical protein CRE_08953 [Caenorhabditis remanei]